MLTTLPSSCAVVMKSGNLNFLETSGPLQACNGTALPYSSTGQILTNRNISDTITAYSFREVLASNHCLINVDPIMGFMYL
jgi:hypothetical protein